MKQEIKVFEFFLQIIVTYILTNHDPIQNCSLKEKILKIEAVFVSVESKYVHFDSVRNRQIIQDKDMFLYSAVSGP